MTNNGGFTLIELILVTVIIGILSGAVVLTFRGRGEEARIARAKSDIFNYETAIEAYSYDHNGKFPRSLDELVTDDTHQYVRQVQLDPWHNPYQYRAPGTHQETKKRFDLFSCGPDGQPHTEDDIVNWKQ